MNILERQILSKKETPDGGEDRIVVTRNFAAVIDGATSKTPMKFDGRTGGAMVADCIAEVLGKLPPQATAFEAVKAFTDVTQAKVFEAFNIITKPGEDRPNASVVMYSAARREIWRVGDCHFAVDDVAYQGQKQIDQMNAEVRAAYNLAFLANGGTTEQLMQRDIGREIILPSLTAQPMLANNAKIGAYGYGCINGLAVPPDMIEVLPVPAEAKTVILASDGYLTVQSTLAESETYLKDYLKRDPLLIAKHASTKGITAGNASFDDRAWLKFRL